MERAWLESELAAGRSIEAIARTVGRDPSTVAYWVNKHGLVSQHAAKHAARGGLDREVLVPLVERGLSVQQIAEELGEGGTTVRHWLRKPRARRPSVARLAPTILPEPAEAAVSANLPASWRHDFVRSRDGKRGIGVRLMPESRRSARGDEASSECLIEEAGGRCFGSAAMTAMRCAAVPPPDPAQKAFAIAGRGLARSLDRARAEVRKCVLLCRCHCRAEVESGLAPDGSEHQPQSPIRGSTGPG